MFPIQTDADCVFLQRSHAYESPAESMLDNMLRIRMLDSSVEPYLTHDTTANGFTVRDCRPIASLFEHSTSWIDFFCPRVASVEAVVFKDATAVRFTTQHVACDAFGMFIPSCCCNHANFRPRSLQRCTSLLRRFAWARRKALIANSNPVHFERQYRQANDRRNESGAQA